MAKINVQFINHPSARLNKTTERLPFAIKGVSGMKFVHGPARGPLFYEVQNGKADLSKPVVIKENAYQTKEGNGNFYALKKDGLVIYDEVEKVGKGRTISTGKGSRKADETPAEEPADAVSLSYHKMEARRRGSQKATKRTHKNVNNGDKKQIVEAITALLTKLIV